MQRPEPIAYTRLTSRPIYASQLCKSQSPLCDAGDAKITFALTDGSEIQVSRELLRLVPESLLEDCALDDKMTRVAVNYDAVCFRWIISRMQQLWCAKGFHQGKYYPKADVAVMRALGMKCLETLTDALGLSVLML